jgi:hypothetical protein
MPDNRVSQIPQVNNASHRKPSWPISTERKNDNPLVVDTTISTAPAVGAGFYVLYHYFMNVTNWIRLWTIRYLPPRERKRGALCVYCLWLQAATPRAHTLRDIPIKDTPCRSIWPRRRESKRERVNVHYVRGATFLNGFKWEKTRAEFIDHYFIHSFVTLLHSGSSCWMKLFQQQQAKKMEAYYIKLNSDGVMK